MKALKFTVFFGVGLLFSGAFGFSLMEQAGAAPLSLKDSNRISLNAGAIAKLNPNLFIPFDPVATPAASPEASPDGSGAPLTPIGYNLDSNDYLFYFYDNKFSLKIDDSEVKEYTKGQILRIVMTPLGDNPATDLIVGVTLLEPGKFKIQVADFDASKYKVSLEMAEQGSNPTPAAELNPKSIIELVAHNMNALMYPGENTVEANAIPEQHVVLGNREVVYLFSEKSGTLLITSRDILDKDEIPENPSPSPNPPTDHPKPPTDNPQDTGNNNQPGPGGSQLPAAAGSLGGGQGGLKCSLQASDSGMLIDGLALLGFGLGFKMLGRRKRGLPSA